MRHSHASEVEISYYRTTAALGVLIQPKDWCKPSDANSASLPAQIICWLFKLNSLEIGNGNDLLQKGFSSFMSGGSNGR
jgi:hypothetical protein